MSFDSLFSIAIFVLCTDDISQFAIHIVQHDNFRFIKTPCRTIENNQPVQKIVGNDQSFYSILLIKSIIQHRSDRSNYAKVSLTYYRINLT